MVLRRPSPDDGYDVGMRSTRNDTLAVRPALAALGLAFVLAACGGPSPSGSPTPGPTTAPTTAPGPTEVPGGQTPGTTDPTESPAPIPPTTQTDWGLIVDVLPADFPVFPGAAVAGPPAEAVSGAFIASAGVDEVAAWYRDALEATGKSTLDLTAPLEDGSRMLDMQGDLPECQLRVTFRPAGESTMIIVLLGAGCFGLGG